MNEIVLRCGNHDTREEGMCAMEFVAWVANEKHTDKPECVDPFLRDFFIRLNDRLEDGERQMLRPYLGRCIGTRDDGVSYSGRAVELFDPLGSGNLCLCEACCAHAAMRVTDLRAALDALLPTEQLPWVAEAIAEKVAASA